jgi:hypothetical protein
MGAITRARSLDRRTTPHPTTRLDEGTYVLDPCALVEVHSEEPAGLIREERVDAHHVSAREVAYHRGIVELDERLIRAVAGVSALPSPPNVLTPAKQRAGSAG